MIKKFFIAVAFIWFAFLAVLVFREDIVGFLGQPKNEPVEKKKVPSIVVSPPPAPPPPPPVSTPKEEIIPFTPLPAIPPAKPKNETVDQVINLKPQTEEEPKPIVQSRNFDTSEQFGLICTKFEKVPSRFRLVSWEGTKKVQLEDLSKIDSTSKEHPKFWIRIREPYKELIHPTSKESFFRPTIRNDPNKRLRAISFEIKNEALNYSAKLKKIGYLILRDYKIGGPPYQITSEMDAPLTSSYILHFEQSLGPNKFPHNLTRKSIGFPFGVWGFEYKVSKQNFAENKITVLRKEKKTGKVIEKELFGPTPL